MEAATTAPASVQVLTNSELFDGVAVFIDGVPHHVLQFKAANAPTSSSDDAAEYSLDHSPPVTPLWMQAVRSRNKRVLEALKALAATPRYAVSPHVQFDSIVGFALTQLPGITSDDSLDVAFLDWVFTHFSSAQQRHISDEQFATLALYIDAGLANVEWLDAHSYDFPAVMMDTAAAAGNLAVVEFLHEHSRNGCTTHAMDDAARNGHLAVVTFLHTRRSEGCTRAAQGGAMANGHVGVLEFLHAHRSEGCQPSAIDHAAANGHVVCIAFAHTHGFVGFSFTTLSSAVAAGHLDVVRYLHEHRSDACSFESLLEAEANGHHDVVDYLCKHRPMKSPGAVIKDATRLGLVRLAAKLTGAAVTAPWKKTYYYVSNAGPVIHAPRLHADPMPHFLG